MALVLAGRVVLVVGVVSAAWMVLVGMTLTALLWPIWLAVAAGIVLAVAMVLQAAEMVLAAVMAPIVDVGVLSLNAEKNYEDTAMVVVLSAELCIGPCTL